MVQRLLVPVVLLAVAVGAGWQATKADEAADKPPPTITQALPPEAATPLLSVRRVPEFLQGPEADRQLVANLAALAATMPEGSCLSVTNAEETFFDHQAQQPLIPASTQKLLVAAAALDLLGPDATFTTRAMSQALPVDGVLVGDIWLVGAGDPLLMTDAYVDRYVDTVPSTDLEALADAVVAAGVREIQGSVLGDGTRYDEIRYVPSWPPRFTNLEQNQSGPLGALMFNDGFAVWPLDPRATGAAVAAEDPAAHAAGLFDDLLEARGVVISGSPTAAITPLDATNELARITSPPLTDVVAQMLSQSDNTTAELLLKEVSAVDGDVGSTADGAATLLETLGGLGIDTSGVQPVDGSGLDAGNRVTCRALVDVLNLEGPESQLAAGLAIAGRLGTLRERLVGTEAEGILFAKTGSLLDVRSLAGFVDPLDADPLTFALVLNADPLPENWAAVQDQLALELAAYPRLPAIDGLEPLAPSGTGTTSVQPSSPPVDDGPPSETPSETESGP